MKMKFTFLILLTLTFSFLETLPLKASESKAWESYLQSGYDGKGLPDFSYAGYHYGEAEIPESKGEVFKVEDFGAKANDEGDDREAIQKAIDAASKNGGTVLFGKGRYLIKNRSENDKQPNLRITSSNVILKGSGSEEGGTELFFPDLLQAPSPEKMWKTPWRLTIGRDFDQVPQLEAEKELPSIKIAEAASQGAFSMTVTDSALFKEGDVVQLCYSSGDYTIQNALLKGGPWHKEWTFPLSFRELHRIQKIKGKILTFDSPLHINMNPEWTVQKTD
ncbi:MAG: glycosyl hydrolase family 28-related protein, partial [Verrucomicrobiota bacterium]